MDKFKKLIAFFMLAFLQFGSLSISADTVEELIPEKLAVSLVIDTSGSMADTDPDRLRETAANIFIDLLSPEDNLGIITFNTNTIEVLPITPVGTSENKVSIKSTLAPNLNATGDTNYQAAIQAASNQLTSFSGTDVRKIIIFLTDGVPDPDPAKRDDAAFMNEYMGKLWSTVSETGLKKYPIYSVGFGAVNKDILNRISTDTQGEARFIAEPAELATSFFNILSTLKNRRSFLETAYAMTGPQAIEFDFDAYTSQVTMVLANETPGIEVILTPPAGRAVNSNVVVSKNEQYTLLTLNQISEELAGRWKIDLIGNGNVTAFGDKDLFLKSWVTKPLANTQHPVNEPLEIQVGITGNVPDNVVVEAIVKKNGTPELNPVILTPYEGFYMGVYDKADTQGAYELEIRVKQNSNIITSTTSKVNVRELPVLKSDFYADNAVYKLNGATTATAFLEMRGNKVTASQDISISTFNLLLSYENGTEQILPLNDSEDPLYGDIRGGDGIFSTKVPFGALGSTKASLLVQGVYKGDNFILEKTIGTYKVVPPGGVRATVTGTDLYSLAGGNIVIPMRFVNDSESRETLTLSLDETIGKLGLDKVVLEPNQTLDQNIPVTLNSGLENKVNDMKITYAAEDPLTAVENPELNVEIQILTKGELRMRNFRARLPFYLTMAFIFLGMPILIVLFGLILYMLLVRPNTLVTGRLLYYKNGEELTEGAVNEIPIKKKKRKKIRISFAESSQEADFTIEGNKSTYSVVLENHVEKRKWKFIDGFSAFLGKTNPSRLILKAVEPSIFLFKGEVYTRKELYDKDVFEIAGYTFQYYTEKKKAKEKEQGKNILEGRM